MEEPAGIGEGLPPSDRISRFEEELDSMIADMVPVAHPGEIVLDLLNRDHEYLKKMTAQECAEDSIILSQYAIFLQRQCNRNKAAIRWAERNIEAVTGVSKPFLSVIRERPSAEKLEAFRIKCQTRVDSLEFISKCVSNLVDQLSNLGKYKHSESFR